MTTAAPTRPPDLAAVDFYERAQPLVEQLAAMARQWRDTVSREAWADAVEAHNEFMALAIRVDLRLARYGRCRSLPAASTLPTGGS